MPRRYSRDMLREAAPTLSAARRGNVAAFNRLIDACQDEAYALAFRLLGDESSASQALQHAVSRAHNQMDRCRGEFRLWFLRTVVESCRATEGTVLKPGRFGVTAVPGVTAGDVQSLLNSLPLELRLSAVLVDILGLSYDQAALVAGVQVSSIRRSVALARYSLV